MQLVVPMAGLGKRFADAGYTLPKPLIPVAGVPMVVRVVRDLPPASRIVFVCHPDHVAHHHVDEVLRSHFPGCAVVVAPGLTEGQACSVRLAVPHLDPGEGVLVAACDNTHVYDATEFRRLAAGSDAVIWTYRGEPRVLANPHWYGWVEAGPDRRASRVSVKVPISATPLRDRVISGTFWFRSAGMLRDGIDELVALNRRVNNEFYLDAVLGLQVERGRRVFAFDVDKYIGWGTPDDLEDFERWKGYFAGTRAA